jgi:predicted small lipoprotein YifL
MKRAITTWLVATLLAVTLIGCATQKQPTTLPAGAMSAADASSYRVLNDAHAFLRSIRDSVSAGKLTLTATQKTAFNNLVASSNAADALWTTCHNGGCTAAQQQQLTTQTNNLNATLATVQSQIVVVNP